MKAQQDNFFTSFYVNNLIAHVKPAVLFPIFVPLYGILNNTFGDERHLLPVNLCNNLGGYGNNHLLLLHCSLC